MNEYFLHHLWKFQKFRLPVFTTNGEEIQVFFTGFHNHNSGPDFEEARIKVGGIQWFGQVEIHLYASDWFRHGHQHDPAYENVILHVVWDADQEIPGIPTIELRHIIDPQFLETYQSHMASKQAILCKSSLGNVPTITISSMLVRVLIERLESKANVILQRVAKSSNNWETGIYKTISSGFGFSVNKQSFLQLAELVPYSIFKRIQFDHVKLEALFFGVAGLIKMTDDYSDLLHQEYQHLKNKFQIQGQMTRVNWKFSKMRIPNFPTVRLAQLSSFFAHHPSFLSEILAIENVKHAYDLLEVTTSKYWQKHFDFGKETTKSFSFGTYSKQILIINVFAPVLAAFARYSANDLYMDKAVHLLEQIPAEVNTVTKQWNGLVPSNSSVDSQGALQLHNEYCLKKKCLSCSIGLSILT